MSFPQSGESTFPDSRNPVRMDTEDQSFAGKPSHNTNSTKGTHEPFTTQGAHDPYATQGTHEPFGTHGTAGRTDNNVSTFTETMPLTGAPLVHHVHRDDEPLPGAKGGAKTFDYSPENIENANNLPTGARESRPFHSGDQTTGGHANTARAYGGSTTEASGDFRGPSITSMADNSDGSAGLSATHGSNNHTGTNFAGKHKDGDLLAKEVGANTGTNVARDMHNTSNTHHTSSHVPQPVGDLKPHTGNNNNNTSVGRTDNYNTVPAAGNHELNHPSHHTGAADKTPYDGAGNEPTNKASIGDKIIGTTEQIAGKIANNPALQEKGEIRKAGLKN